MTYCRNNECGIQLSEEDAFCRSCGTPLKQTLVTPMGEVEGYGSVMALRSTDRSSKNYQTVVFRNETDGDLTNVVIRTHNHIKCLDVLSKDKLLSLSIPRDAQQLFMAASSDDSRLSLCWDLVQVDLQTKPTVIVKGAADVKGNVRVKATGDTPPEIIIKDAADVHGDVEVEYTQTKEDEKLVPVPLASETVMENFSPLLSCRRNKRYILFAGNSLTIGRDASSLWQVHCREHGGTDILLQDKHRQKYSFSEQDLPGEGFLSPVSKVHATLKWDGASRKITIVDGSGQKASSRGICVDGLLIEGGGEARRQLPLKLTLDSPAKEMHVDLQCDIIMTPDHKPVIFIHQCDCSTNETLIWAPASLGFGFSGGYKHHWEPTWSKANEQLSLLREESAWKIASAQDKSTSWPVYEGMRLAIDDLAYMVGKVDKDLLIMEHCR